VFNKFFHLLWLIKFLIVEMTDPPLTAEEQEEKERLLEEVIFARSPSLQRKKAKSMQFAQIMKVFFLFAEITL